MTHVSQLPTPAPRLRRIHRWTRFLAAVFLAAYFWRFCLVVLPFRFGTDELMNIDGHWEHGAWKVILANITFWSTFNRPMGAIYYLPLFTFFGLNPVPFTVVRLAIVLSGAWIFYRLASRISGKRGIGAVSALPLIYHAGMPSLVYEGSFVFDLLCGVFFFGALLYYIRARETQGRLDLRRICVFLALYICALNSKEMAVSLPVLVVAFELLRQSPKLADLGPAIAATAVTVIYIAGKTLGDGALISMESYRPVVTWARFSESTAGFLNTIFCLYIIAAGWFLVVVICVEAVARRIEKMLSFAKPPI